MKIIVNKCFGGFSLSPKAVARLAELRGQKAYFFKGGIGAPRVRVSMEEIKDVFWAAYNTPTPMRELTSAEWHSMTLEERREHNAKVSAEMLSKRPDDRADSLLIQVVEELGDDANGRFAELKVVEIPDGLQYEIHEYDGLETIHEMHRSW